MISKLRKKIVASSKQASTRARTVVARGAKTARPLVKDLAYSEKIRGAVRTAKVASSPQLRTKARQLEDKLNAPGLVTSLSSETLPDGQYYCRLSIREWHKHLGEYFQLRCNGEVVFGITIERPQRGFGLEYRNIIVSSNDPKDFEISLDCDYRLTFKKGEFTTTHQQTFDDKYEVIQDGLLYYSKRGNLRNPRKLVVTFPGFGPSATRTSYAVTYLKQLSSADLSDTAIFCFQDRYGVAGTYMKRSNAGVDVIQVVQDFIQDFAHRHGISEEDILFFGASKGGTISLLAAEPFPKASLVIVVPQLDLPNFTCKPFFRDNLYLIDSFHDAPQPGELLLRYIEEGRNVAHFFSNEDEQSNASIAEFFSTSPGYRRFRIQGAHGQVAGICLPTCLGLIRQFLGVSEVVESSEEGSLKLYPSDAGFGTQVRLRTTQARPANSNTYLRITANGIHFFQAISRHKFPTVYYSTPRQNLCPALDPADFEAALVVVEATGVERITRLAVSNPSEWPSKEFRTGGPRLFSLTQGDHDFNIVHGARVEDYSYTVAYGDGDEVIVSLEGSSTGELSPSDYRVVITIESTTGLEFLHVFLRRVASTLRTDEISLVTGRSGVEVSAVEVKEHWPRLVAL